MSRFKKISTAFIAIALVMCVGYFSVMSQTSSWFYQASAVTNENNKFTFGDFSVSQNFSMNTDSDEGFNFAAPTSFKDKDEILFDKAVRTESCSVKNTGKLPARIYVTVTSYSKDYTNPGLKYFYYSSKERVNNSVRQTILKTFTDDLTDSALDEYNLGKDGNGGHYVLVNPGEQVTVYVSLWVEYDAISSAFSQDEVSRISYGIKIDLTATQDADGAMSR